MLEDVVMCAVHPQKESRFVGYVYFVQAMLICMSPDLLCFSQGRSVRVTPLCCSVKNPAGRITIL